MAIEIVEMSILSATNTDVLSVGRLNSIPYAGVLTLRFLSDLGTAAANWALTLQLPGGDVPVDSQQVPAGGVIGGMNIRDMLQLSYRVAIGGHVTVSLTETGTAVCYFQAVLRPR